MISPLSCQNSKVPLACAERLYSILDQAEVEETGQRVLESQDVKGAIDFEHVTFGYDLGRTLIKDLTIQVPAASKGCHCRAYRSRKIDLD